MRVPSEPLLLDGLCRTSASSRWLRGRSRGELRHQNASTGLTIRRGGLNGKDQTVQSIEFPFELYVGIDWAWDDYDVTVLARDGGIVAHRKVAHNGKAMQEFLTWLAGLSTQKPATTAIPIEMTRGALVESLLDHNFALFSINPKQMERFRDRHSVAGAKDDPLDCFVAADAPRTDLKRFLPLYIDEPSIVRLRELSRLDQATQCDLTRALNQMSEQLHRYYPRLLTLCRAAEEAWIWDLWEMAPLPAQGAKLTPARIGKLLKRHRIRRLSVKEVKQALGAPSLPVAAGVAEAAAEHVAILLERVRLLNQQRKRLRSTLERMLKDLCQPEAASDRQPQGKADPVPPLQAQPDEPQETKEPQEKQEHRDAQILLSLPAVGTIVGATMLAEAHQALRNRDYHALRAYCGVAPITRRSGRRSSVTMRRACNVRLRNALHYWALGSLVVDPRGKAHYAKLRAAGHSHNRALRGLADRWLSVLISMLKNRTLFDKQRWNHTSAGAVPVHREGFAEG